MNYFLRLSLVFLFVGILPTSAQAIDISGGTITLELRQTTRSFVVGQSPNQIAVPVQLWVFCESGSESTGGCRQSTLDFPGPLLEIGTGQGAAVTLDLTSASTPRENPAQVGYVANFSGHTMHFANLDLRQTHDGVPAPFPPVAGVPINTGGHTYPINLQLNLNHVGSHAYYCHVHQTKHVEMGEFGALIVHPMREGKFLNIINSGAGAATPFDVEANLILSSIDPNYHAINAVGDNPVFAQYAPTIFLVNGLQGLSAGTPAETIKVSAGDVVAIRLIGMHSVNATFEIFNNNPANTAQIGTVAQSLILHNIDGWAQNTPKSLFSVDLAPGQTKDILVTIPRETTGPWFPVVTYRSLLDDTILSPNSKVYSMLDF